MNRSVIIIGAGGHAKVLIDILLIRSVSIIGLTDRDPDKIGQEILGVSVLGGDDSISGYPPDACLLVNAVGSTQSMTQRRDVYEHFKGQGYCFATVVHPSSIISPFAQLSEGAQVMAGAVIQAGSSVGANTIVNTGVSIDHDCTIGAHVHLAPGVILSGGVTVADHAHIGTSAAVIQNVCIGEAALVCAGAVVIKDVLPHTRAIGIPARTEKK